MSSEFQWADPARRPPLDASLYNLQKEEQDFFMQQTGIADAEELRKHILEVQAKAYEVYSYPCIRRFGFTKLKISRIPAYKSALGLLKARENPILLDLGCCFGNDARKAVADGWPVENVIATDLQPAFWKYGHLLFRSTPETFPAAFIPGDAFDPNFIAPPYGPYASIEDVPDYSSPLPSLKDLTSFKPLRGKIHAIHASSFFHLFPEEKQRELAFITASLLSPEPGSIIFGQHVSKPEKGFRDEAGEPYRMFCHSPDSWKALWESVFERKGDIIIDASLQEVERPDLVPKNDTNAKFWVLNWSITRK